MDEPGAQAKRTALGGGWVGEPGAPAKRTKRTPSAVLGKIDICWNYTKFFLKFAQIDSFIQY